MSRFFTADLHLSHRNICNDTFGAGARPFKDYLEMNEAIIENWNSRVNHKDTVYVLGDVAFALTKLNSLENVRRLKGNKVLVLGNHDYAPDKYTEYFNKVMAYKDLRIGNKKVLMSHIPVHPSQFGRWDFNIHGHLHGNNLEDSRYICVSLEQNDYLPFTEEEILSCMGIS